MAKTKAQLKKYYSKLDKNSQKAVKAIYEERYREALFPDSLKEAENMLLAIREYEDERR